jgi:hypothetical protein
MFSFLKKIGNTPTLPIVGQKGKNVEGKTLLFRAVKRAQGQTYQTCPLIRESKEVFDDGYPCRFPERCVTIKKE